jgi:hypothetical protein
MLANKLRMAQHMLNCEGINQNTRFTAEHVLKHQSTDLISANFSELEERVVSKHQKLNSNSTTVAPIKFPEFTGVRTYMVTTTGVNVVLPENLKPYEEQVQNLCDVVGHKGVIHVTVDEKELTEGETHRKPEPHVDGRFLASLNNFNYGWHHAVVSGWNHTCNEIPNRMAVAVASNVPACRVFHGTFIGTPSEQGSLQHISDQLGEGKVISANNWHLLSPDCVHESLPVDTNCKRSFIRVAFDD